MNVKLINAEDVKVGMYIEHSSFREWWPIVDIEVEDGTYVMVVDRKGVFSHLFSVSGSMVLVGVSE